MNWLQWCLVFVLSLTLVTITCWITICTKALFRFYEYVCDLDENR